VEDLGLFEVINTQRQTTHYKPDPVPIDAIETILDAATKAPNGSNLQPWEFVVITDRELIKQVGELYREAWLDLMGRTPAADESAVHKAARYLAHHMPEVPAMILVCVDHLRGRGAGTYKLGDPIVRNRLGASIWPCIQNLFLAARGLGLGTRLTAVHVYREEELKQILNIPVNIETVCLTPLGYPAQPFGPPRRRPATEFTSFNVFGNRHYTP
jgi:nitroreductase